MAGGSLKELSEQLIKSYKTDGREKEIHNALLNLKERYAATITTIPNELAYIEGEDFQNYLHDMALVQQFAKINRETIALSILNHMDLAIDKTKLPFDTVHNYIDIDNMILRKGSVSAKEGEKLLIPINMRDGSLICIGKGNLDWNYSAPHGAGRIMSRSKAKDLVKLEDFKESMKGIYTSSVGQSTIDESPFVYKPMQEIIDNIKDTVDIVNIIKPVYNFKASEIEKEQIKTLQATESKEDMEDDLEL